MLLPRRIRGAKNAERVSAAGMCTPRGMRKMRYGVTQPLAMRLSVCGRTWHRLRSQLRRLTRCVTSRQCCRHFETPWNLIRAVTRYSNAKMRFQSSFMLMTYQPPFFASS